MGKTILVTGGNGFIGRALVDYIEKQGDTPVAVDLPEFDICDPEAYGAIGSKLPGEKEKPDHVIHLAGLTFVPRSWEEPAEFMRVNTGGTLQVLEYCRKQKLPLTYISAYIYGQAEKLPIAETDPVRPNNPYAESKHLAEQLCRFYAKEYDVPVSIIRPFNVYGVGQKENFLIPHILKQVKDAPKIHVMDLVPKRDYIYLTDLVRGIYLTTVHVQQCETFNLGSGISYSVGEAIELAQAAAGTSKPVESEQAVRRNEMNDVVADISAAEEKLGWKPQVSFRDGLAAVLREMES